MANIDTLKASLVTKLQTVSGLKYVYDYRRSQYDGFPCATVSFQNFESEYADNARDLRRYTYQVQIIQEREPHNFGPEKAEQVLASVIDDVMTVIDADSDFSNSEVIYSDPFDVEIDEENEYLIAKFDITMKALINTTI